jgi:hypothetical protein
MGASNNAQGQNAGARQQIDQQTTQAMQRLMQYLSKNQAQPPPGGVTPGAGGAPAPAFGGGTGVGGGAPATPGTINRAPDVNQIPGSLTGGGQTMNPQAIQALVGQLMQRKGPQ